MKLFINCFKAVIGLAITQISLDLKVSLKLGTSSYILSIQSVAVYLSKAVLGRNLVGFL